MHYLVATALAALVAFTGTVDARRAAGIPLMPVAQVRADKFCYGLYPNGTHCPIEAGIFDQLIDHNNPSLGTFKQRYWVSAEFYAGPGSPIVLHGPGESAADGAIWYTTNKTLDGTFAQQLKGAAIVLEHRYWGKSSPFEQMTTKNMRYLTLDLSMRDTIYFARNVKLSFDVDGMTHPEKAPWVFSGGSYPGAMAAWLNKLYPGTFWAYHSSSGVVQSIADFWQYYLPIEAAMPQNCRQDMKKAIKQLDKMLDTTDEKAKNALKGRFGLAGLEDDDFGWAVADALQSWQGIKFSTPREKIKLFTMCDHIEGITGNSTNTTTTTNEVEDGVSTCKALSGLAKWLREVDIPGSCKNFGYWEDPKSIACWDLHNSTSPFFTDRTVGNQWNLQWQWMCCNEPFQLWQASAPGDTGLVSSHLKMQDLRDQCERFFPDEEGFSYGLKRGRTTEDIVKLTGGWDHTNSTRLVYVNGEYDPWLYQTVSSPFRPGGPLKSTRQVPVFVVPKATHCPNLSMANVNSNDALREITDQVIDIITDWVGEWYDEKETSWPGFGKKVQRMEMELRKRD